MPELPEVENVLRGLAKSLKQQSQLHRVHLLSPTLRYALKPKDFKALQGQALVTLSRRAKYLVFEFSDFFLLSHLGMTGSWRWEADSKSNLRRHDHLILEWTKEAPIYLIYNDPRRFGFVVVVAKDNLKASQSKGLSALEAHKFFAHLGPEPLSENFTSKYLYDLSRSKKTPIKSLIMNQQYVVGVGNIYASEALFNSKISPLKLSARLKLSECEILVDQIKNILEQSIQNGGSTLKDYRMVSGDKGSFQAHFQVYGREGEPCSHCKAKVTNTKMSGRSTFWCPRCQK